MLSRDGISGLVCLAISLWLLVLTWGLPPAVMVPIGPAFYPRIVLSILAILSVILLALDLRAAAQRRATGTTAIAAPVQPAPNYPLVLKTFIAFGLYIALLPELGFRIGTVLFVAALQVTLEWPRSTRRWALVAIVALATTLVCFYVFEDYLSVLLPRGRWSGM
ncbi:MAG TPA: tripartite tricarboxylate transporter TctB family protein [Xanthobacteraceae bacterium]|jgi:putative tricarboxylic transport membrane protein|nr:tripartite tricarboxylate transporter TctB family protein [Xanthobacteraceae bacterium]